ncbi:zinc-binding dehydrogenase [Micromonospora sp. CA-240977]|uniref:zinc-binding dehydrogenase n=1 Tax=Micromonospora sp. CA-240977 TaxID=3239957 RepID=UPI003D938A71
MLPSLLTLADVLGTGHHAAVRAGLGSRTSVTVIGDGAVGLMAVLAVRRLGAERIILMGRHKDRNDLGREFGATDVVAERGDEGIEQVRELAGGDGTHTVLECVGHRPAYEQALGVVRVGGVISRVGVPQYDDGDIGWNLFGRNLTLTGGPAPVRRYIEELMPDILDGTIEPGRVFDRAYPLEQTPQGYADMDNRDVLKALVRP